MSSQQHGYTSARSAACGIGKKKPLSAGSAAGIICAETILTKSCCAARYVKAEEKRKAEAKRKKEREQREKAKREEEQRRAAIKKLETGLVPMIKVEGGRFSMGSKSNRAFPMNNRCIEYVWIAFI